jgi:hypothetical protein
VSPSLRHRVLLAAGALAMACSVPGVKTCATDADCMAGGTCSAGICTIPGSGSGGGGGQGGGAGGDQCGSTHCQPYETCQMSAGTGACQPLGVVLSWVQPTNNDVFGPGASVTLVLSAALADGGAFSGTVPFTTDFGASGTLTDKMPSSVNAGASDGPRTIVAGWSGGPDASVSFHVDATPPTLSVLVQDAGRPWVRTEHPYALLSSNEALDPATASLSLQGVAVSAAAPLASCRDAGVDAPTCGTASHCVCLQLDLSAPPLLGLNAGWTVDAGARDLAGNGPGSASTAPLAVTRVAWQRTGLGGLIVSPPALGSDGTLYVGTASGSSDRLYALERGTGATRWTNAVGAVQSVAVAASPDAGEVVVFAANTATKAILGAALTGDGGTLPGACQVTGSPASTSAGVALAREDFGAGPEWVAVGSISYNHDVNSNPYAVRLGISCVTPPCCSDTSYMASPSPGPTTPVANIAIDGAQVYFIGSSARVFAFSFVPMSGFTGLGNVQVASATGTSTLPGIALLRDGAINKLALGGSGSSPDMHFLTPNTNNFNTSTFTTLTMGGSNVGQPAVIDRTRIWAGAGGMPPTVDVYSFADGGTTPGVQTAGGYFAPASPVLGAGGLGYAIDLGGGLTVFSTSQPATTVWSGVLPDGAGAIAASTLDCQRDSNGSGVVSTLGVLYIASVAGSVTAVIVDSPKLDTTAQWPKYGRDAQNSGNPLAGLPLNPGCP